MTQPRRQTEGPPFVDIIAGARPNFMKIAPIIRAIEEHHRAVGSLEYRLVHTGQHYDLSMSGKFFDQLGIPAPHANLDVGSGSHAAQAGMIMLRYEQLLATRRSKICVVVGDVNSTMACAIVAKKAGVMLAHVEAGIRSGDWSMPEEVNRVVTDSLANHLFTTSRWAGENLARMGVRAEQIHFVGNTMIDTLLANVGRLRAPSELDGGKLEARRYFVLTLHRPANVDDIATFRALLVAVVEGSRGLPVVFPVHPRTAESLRVLGALPPQLICVPPQPYLEFVWLVKHALAVITDSGGITEEATVLGVPCLTLRDTTERPETVELGTNVLVGTRPEYLGPVFDDLFSGRWKQGTIPELWDGRAGERIVSVLADLLA